MKRKQDYPFFHTDEEPDASTRFADSVDAFTVKDVHNLEKARERSQTVSLLIRSVAIALCIGLLGYSVFMIADKMISERIAREEYENLQVDESKETTILRSKDLPEPNAMPTVLEMLEAEGVYSPYVPGKEVTEDKSQHYLRLHQNFMKVAQTYENVYAWVYMTGTGINYPVMKGTDNDFYLLHNFKGQSSRSGSIMADCNLSSNFYSNYNVVLYGHNMRDGSMFHSLKGWCNSANIKSLVQNSQIEIYTTEGVYVYNILSYYVDNSNQYATVSFTDQNEYLTFLDTISKKSYIRTNRPYTADSKICTLITCTNGGDGDSRYVVHGILRNFIPVA